ISNKQGKAPLTVVFSGCGYDSDGDYLTYQWDFGDGSYNKNQSAVHTYNKPGKYLVRLNAEDTKGNASTAVEEIIVEK
ncbi:PKD domain-containing protein, partial [Candidatus Woesearchaeota archaeon]|nr:PKD domain-containing protein [Candidatus Woesearchaeota archaeon]